MFTREQLAQAYSEFDGPVVVAAMANPRPAEKTFRNNKYSIFNMGRQATALGRYGFKAVVDRV